MRGVRDAASSEASPSAEKTQGGELCRRAGPEMLDVWTACLPHDAGERVLLDVKRPVGLLGADRSGTVTPPGEP